MGAVSLPVTADGSSLSIALSDDAVDRGTYFLLIEQGDKTWASTPFYVDVDSCRVDATFNGVAFGVRRSTASCAKLGGDVVVDATSQTCCVPARETSELKARAADVKVDADGDAQQEPSDTADNADQPSLATIEWR